MKTYKTRVFKRWAKDEKLEDEMLSKAVQEMQDGLIDARLGGNVYKKRVASQGRGKSGGVRTLIAFKVEDKAFFMYGFAKNERDNISRDELAILKRTAEELFGYSEKELAQAVTIGELFEVISDEE